MLRELKIISGKKLLFYSNSLSNIKLHSTVSLLTACLSMVKAYFNSENFSLRRIRHANYSRNPWHHIVMCLPTKTAFFFNKEHVLLYY